MNKKITLAANPNITDEIRRFYQIIKHYIITLYQKIHYYVNTFDNPTAFKRYV